MVNFSDDDIMMKQIPEKYGITCTRPSCFNVMSWLATIGLLQPIRNDVLIVCALSILKSHQLTVSALLLRLLRQRETKLFPIQIKLKTMLILKIWNNKISMHSTRSYYIPIGVFALMSCSNEAMLIVHNMTWHSCNTLMLMTLISSAFLLSRFYLYQMMMNYFSNSSGMPDLTYFLSLSQKLIW